MNNSIKYNKYLKGSIVAIITPMDNDLKIDKKSLKNIINYHINNNTNAILLAGTTGEVKSISFYEYLDLIFTSIRYVKNRIPIIVGIYFNAINDVINLIKYLEKTSIFACLINTPFYEKPSQDGLYLYFKKISDNTSLPKILYNIPSRTGIELSPDTIAKLSNLHNIVGIKESTNNLNKIIQIKKLINSENFALFCGHDEISLNFMKLGGNGVISVVANMIPKLFSKFCNYALIGDFSKAKKIEKKFKHISNLLYVEPNPAPIKWILYYLGFINYYYPRLPILPLSYSKQKILEKYLKKFFLYLKK